MRCIGMILTAFSLGFLTAIPIGASQIEVAKRVLAHRMKAAILTAAGTVTSDMMYGFVALFGIAPFLEKPVVLEAFGWVGALVLAVLAVSIWRQAEKVQARDAAPRWASSHVSYLTGFLLGVTYPPIMLSWLVGFALIKKTGLVTDFTPLLRTAFVVAGGAGLFSYQVLLAMMIRRTHHLLTHRTLAHIHRVLAVILALLSMGFLASGIQKMF